MLPVLVNVTPSPSPEYGYLQHYVANPITFRVSATAAYPIVGEDNLYAEIRQSATDTTSVKAFTVVATPTGTGPWSIALTSAQLNQPLGGADHKDYWLVVYTKTGTVLQTLKTYRLKLVAHNASLSAPAAPIVAVSASTGNSFSYSGDGLFFTNSSGVADGSLLPESLTTQLLGDSTVPVSNPGIRKLLLTTAITAARTFTIQSSSSLPVGTIVYFADVTGSLSVAKPAILATAGGNINGQSTLSVTQPFAVIQLINCGSSGWAAEPLIPTSLATGRTIALTGDVSYTSPAFDGSANVTAPATLATVNSTPGSFGGTTAIPVLTIDGKGRITAATTAAIASTGPTVQILGDSNTTIATGTTVARITAISTARTYTLPNPVNYPAGSTLTVLDAIGNLSSTTVATLDAGAFTINGLGTMALSTPYSSPILVSNGINGWTLDIRGVSRGGTGATDATGARTNLGLGAGNSPAFTALTLGTSGNLSGGTNLIEQRNGASTPQAFRVYNTFPNSTANEWLEIDWQKTVNVARIGTAHAGGGSNRELYITAGTNIRLFSTGGSSVIVRNSGDTANYFEVSTTAVNVSRNLMFPTDGFYDIGTSSNNRPKDIYASGNVNAGSWALTSTYGLAFSGVPITNWNGQRFSIGSTSHALIMASTIFRFNGDTNAFPAIKRNGTGIDIRLADDSGFAPVKGKLTTDTAYTATVVAATTGYITIYDSTGTAYRVPCVV